MPAEIFYWFNIDLHSDYTSVSTKNVLWWEIYKDYICVWTGI